MFTGIIKDASEVAAVRKMRGNLLVAVAKPARWKVTAGESVSVSGICSTVTKVRRGRMEFEYTPETLRKTTAGSWRVGVNVNLERSLKVGDALDGHLVMGHVDGVGRIAGIKKEGRSRVLRIAVAEKIGQPIVPKGSVAVEGVSLTVVDACPPTCPPIGRRVGRGARGYWFSVALIPYTLSRTTLGKRRVGDRVNIETDILAKYATKSQG